MSAYCPTVRKFWFNQYHTPRRWVEALGAQQPDSAAKFFGQANAIFDGHALCNYYLGGLAYGRADYAGAKAYFDRARDLDGLRFRAPSPINEAIEKMCKRYASAHLVDTRAAFDNSSAHEIIGADLMLEHVHPNLKGYSIISGAFYEALSRERIIASATAGKMALADLVGQMPITGLDSLIGACRVSKLKSSWPFSGSLAQDSFRISSEEARLADEVVNGHKNWPDAVDELYNGYLGRNELAKAATLMASLVLEHPTEPFFCEKGSQPVR